MTVKETPQHCVNNIFISPSTVPYSVTYGGRCSCAQQEEAVSTTFSKGKLFIIWRIESVHCS